MPGRSPAGGSGNPLQYSCLRIPWTEEPGGLQSMGLQRVRDDWATEHTHTHNPKDRSWHRPVVPDRKQAGALSRSRPGSPALKSGGESHAVSRSMPLPHTTHCILFSSLLFKSYLPCEDRLAVRNEHDPPTSLLGQCRDDLAQGQQWLVNAHAFLGTRSNILIKPAPEQIYLTKYISS